MNDNTWFNSALLYGRLDVKNGSSLLFDISSQTPTPTHFKYLLRFSIFSIPQYLLQISMYSVDACSFSVHSVRRFIERLDLSLPRVRQAERSKARRASDQTQIGYRLAGQATA